MYTKEDWKDEAVKLAALVIILSESDSDKMTLGDAIAFKSLFDCVRKVANMAHEELDGPDDEQLHEAMEQAAKEICDEQ